MYLPPDAQQDVIKTALRVIQATHYYPESDPHASAEQEYSSEELALACRDLVEAVNKMPEEKQPSGWAQQTGPSVKENPSAAGQQSDSAQHPSTGDRYLDRVDESYMANYPVLAETECLVTVTEVSGGDVSFAWSNEEWGTGSLPMDQFIQKYRLYVAPKVDGEVGR